MKRLPETRNIYSCSENFKSVTYVFYRNLSEVSVRISEIQWIFWFKFRVIDATFHCNRVLQHNRLGYLNKG